MSIPGMKQRLRIGETLAGYVATIPSAVSVQAMAAAGADWIGIDQEHGAEGIVFPLVGNAEEAAECVALTRYPPSGRRSWGPFVAHARWGRRAAGLP